VATKNFGPMGVLGSFHVNLNFPDSVMLEKKIFEYFSYINRYKERERERERERE
jgi:hypothetical protein